MNDIDQIIIRNAKNVGVSFVQLFYTMTTMLPVILTHIYDCILFWFGRKEEEEENKLDRER